MGQLAKTGAWKHVKTTVVHSVFWWIRFHDRIGTRGVVHSKKSRIRMMDYAVQRIGRGESSPSGQSRRRDSGILQNVWNTYYRGMRQAPGPCKIS